jgi:hypothetical protein
MSLFHDYKGYKKMALLIVLCAFLLVGCGPTETPTPTPIPAAPDYKAVLDKYRTTPTDLQRKAYNDENLMGRQARWNGYVLRVAVSPKNYKFNVVSVDMSGTPDELGGTVYVIVLQAETKDIQLDEHVYFTGWVTDTDKNGSLILESAHLLKSPALGKYAPKSHQDLLDAYVNKSRREWMAVRQQATESQISWKGWVLNVTEDGLVLLSANKDDDHVDVYLHGLPKEEVMSLKVGQEYNVKATIYFVEFTQGYVNFKTRRFVTVYTTTQPLASLTPTAIPTPVQQ